MFHMLSCFNLKDGEDIDTFRGAFAEFVTYMKSVELVEDSGPIRAPPLAHADGHRRRARP